jgi:hypothetical protein
VSFELARRQEQTLQIRGGSSLPSLIVDAGENAAEKFIEFFTAQIRNRNTREAYPRAVGHFMAWCEKRGLSLPSIRPVHVAAYIEKLPVVRQN